MSATDIITPFQIAERFAAESYGFDSHRHGFEVARAQFLWLRSLHHPEAHDKGIATAMPRQFRGIAAAIPKATQGNFPRLFRGNCNAMPMYFSDRPPAPPGGPMPFMRHGLAGASEHPRASGASRLESALNRAEDALARARTRDDVNDSRMTLLRTAG